MRNDNAKSTTRSDVGRILRNESHFMDSVRGGLQERTAAAVKTHVSLIKQPARRTVAKGRLECG